MESGKRNIDLELIYNTYVDDLYSYAVYLGFDRYVVMDAIHDVFFNLCNKENSTDDIQDIKFYLFRALKNNLINTYNRTKNTVSLQNIDDLQDDLLGMEDKLIGEDENRLIKKKIDLMLNSLTKKQREIIYFRYVQEYDYAQISELLNITPVSCRKLVQKAMRNLRKNHPLLTVLFLLV